MIEVVETFRADSTVFAELVGGRQRVTIEEVPGHVEREFYNPSAGAHRSAGRARSKEHQVPRLFRIRHQNTVSGTSTARTYEDALRLAMHHASRKPLAVAS